jgi:hypothetical protein
MKTTITLGIGVILSCFVIVGCDHDLPAPNSQSNKDQTQTADNGKAPAAPCCEYGRSGTVSDSAQANTAAAGQKPAEPMPPKIGEGKRTKLSKNVWLEILPGDKRVVLIDAQVCLREPGMMLEHLLCKKMTKEHEAILHADIDAFFIHTALIAAKAEPGKPVQFVPSYKPAHGTVIRVWVQYKDKNGKTVAELGQKWIRNKQTKKELQYDWVFAGSRLEPDPVDRTKPGFYLANSGDVICIANFPSSMLDLPVANEKETTRLDFEPFTDRIPALKTPVTVILEPVLAKKK